MERRALVEVRPPFPYAGIRRLRQRAGSGDAATGRTPTDWVLDYMRAEVDCVAVTDHNTGRWIDQLKEALSGTRRKRSSGLCRELHLFPGMEISVNGGIHLLAIFDPSKIVLRP